MKRLFLPIDMDSAVFIVSKKSRLGASTELNYAVIYSLVARLIEHIQTVQVYWVVYTYFYLKIELQKCLKFSIMS
jgi:hypothetical protein